MDIYRINDRRQRFNSPGFQRNNGKDGQRQSGLATQLLTKKNRQNPFLSTASYPMMTVPDVVRVYEDYQGCFALERDVPSVLRSINESKMSAIARLALKRNNFRIQGWRARKLDGGSRNPVTLGLYRFEGIGSDYNEWLDWSIILKVIQSPANLGYENLGEGDNQAHWNYWKRELLLYQSGWTELLPEGIAAPHCYEAMEIQGNIAGIWMEDVNDSFAGNWPLHRYALAARHLGRLNGIYISRRELPTFSWLSRQRTRQWLSSIPWQEFQWDHPLVWQQYPNPEIDSFRCMLQDNGRFLAKLEQVPKTICHGDTYPTNFSSRRSPRNQEQTVALDWSQVGIEPLGDDLGQLVYGTYQNLRGYRLQDISETLFTSYVNGLQDSGCRVDTQLVRFGYAASAAFRVGLNKLVLLNEQMKREDDFMPHSVNHPIISEPFESVMADEAYRLLDKT